MTIEVPGPGWYRFARSYERFGLLRRGIGLTFSGAENVPREGPVSAVANHRNDRYDLVAIGLAMKKRRAFYAPAKIELKTGLKGRILEGCGALFFVREDPQDRKRVAELMDWHIKQGHMVLTMAEGTSKIVGPQLAPMDRSPLKLATDNGLDSLLLVGVGGTDTYLDPETRQRTERPKRIHVEIGSLAVPNDLATIRQKRDFHNEVVVPSLQEVVDVAYAKAV